MFMKKYRAVVLKVIERNDLALLLLVIAAGEVADDAADHGRDERADRGDGLQADCAGLVLLDPPGVSLGVLPPRPGVPLPPGTGVSARSSGGMTIGLRRPHESQDEPAAARLSSRFRSNAAR